MSEKTTAIYGKHAVRDVITLFPKAVRTVYCADDAARAAFKAQGIATESFPKKLPSDVPHDAVHQGYIATVTLEKLMLPFDTFIKDVSVTNDTAFVILGELQDPHNVGAIIRSAAAFGIAGVLIPEHRQVQLTGSVIKASAGMAFRVPLVSIGNVNTTIRDLKEKGFWIYGLDGEATQSLMDEGFEKPSVFILGNEGDGIRQKTLLHCDIPLSIPIAGGVESLNASVAAAVTFYAWSRKHPSALAAKS